MRILIVADNAVTANGIKLEMRHATGCRIVGFLSGRRSCELIAAQEKPDVVLLDDMHSTELTLERIAELRRAVPDAKIVLLTLCMDANWLAEASEAGIHAAVAKVARPGGIGTLVREIVRGNVFHAFESGATRSVAQASRAHRPRARDPAARRVGQLEPAHRRAPLGDRADGQVPPLERLPEARRLQPHGGEPPRPHGRTGRRCAGCAPGATAPAPGRLARRGGDPPDRRRARGMKPLTPTRKVDER